MKELPVADELAAMGIDIDCGLGASIHEEYVPVTKDSLQAQVSRIVSNKDSILEYRDAQSMILTEVQAKLLGAITDRKIQEASLRDIVGAYKVLKDKELVADGKPTEIVGFVGYLMELEEEEKAQAKKDKEADIIVIQAETTDGAENDGGNVRCLGQGTSTTAKSSKNEEETGEAGTVKKEKETSAGQEET